MAEIPQEEPLATQPSTLAWTTESPPKAPDYYKDLRDEYSSFIFSHELFPMLQVIEAVAARTISLLTADVKLRKYMAVSREAMEEAIKEAKVLARRSNAMWDILLVTEERAKSLAGSILTSKTLRFQTEYISTQITLHGVPTCIMEKHFGAFLSEHFGAYLMEVTSSGDGGDLHQK